MPRREALAVELPSIDGLRSELRSAKHGKSRSIGSIKKAENNNKTPSKIGIPDTALKRPRTRSSLLRSPECTVPPLASAPKRRRKLKNSAQLPHREVTPVIDLTTDNMSIEQSFQQEQDDPLADSSTQCITSTPERSINQEIEEGTGSCIFGGNGPEHPRLGGNGHEKPSVALNPLLNLPCTPQLMYNAEKRPEPCFELNSSPIKRNPSGLNLNLILTNTNLLALLSSPTKKPKSVAFSDNLASDIIEEYSVLPNYMTPNTPRRSILKLSNSINSKSPLDPSNSSAWVKSPRVSLDNHCPSNPSFWQSGTIVQLDCKSNDLPQLVEGCITVLEDPAFDKKFEVYATLNLVCKANDSATLKDLFLDDESAWLSYALKKTGFKRKNLSSYIILLSSYAQRDIGLLETTLFMKKESHIGDPPNNPFDSRILNQVLKLIASLLAVPALNLAISVKDMKYFYSHTCDVLVKPNIPKSLVAPYLSIIKDCHISPKKRKLVFESSPELLLEKLLFALLNMKNFVSSSLINEKFIALRNLIQNFPNVLAKNFHQWFPGFLLNLCDLSFVLFTKVIGTGVIALLETARSYLDVPDVSILTRRILESPIPTEAKSWISENLLSIDFCSNTTTAEYVIDNLKELIQFGHFKSAMDIWVGLTLLLGDVPGGFENWKHLSGWLQVHKMCFNDKSPHAKEIALSSWKAVTYKICFHELKHVKAMIPLSINSPKQFYGAMKNLPLSSWEQALRPKIKLITHPFLCVSSLEIRNELVEAFHKSFLAILHSVFNFQQKSNTKFFQVCWEKMALPVVLNFYFQKNASTSYMHQLGFEIMMGLFKPQPGINDKPPNNIRCLSNDPLTISEIYPFNPRWLHLRFEKVYPALLSVFQLNCLSLDKKLHALQMFLTSMRLVLQKEILPSNATFDLIDTLPVTLETILEDHEISYETTFKLLINLIDVFGAPHLVPASSSKSVFEVILARSCNQFSSHQMNAILTMLYGAVGEKKCLAFLLILCEVSKMVNKEDMYVFIGDCLNNRKSNVYLMSDMITISAIFRSLDRQFAVVAKKLIQQLVLLRAEEFETLVAELKISLWSPPIFTFFLILMQDAPYDHLKRTTLKLMEAKLNDPDLVECMLTFMFEQKTNSEIYQLRDCVMPKLKLALKNNENLRQLWINYIKEFSEEITKLDQILVSAFRQNIEVEYLVTERWDQLPELRTEWTSKYGLDCSESNSFTSGVFPAVAERLDNLLEKEILNSQVLLSTVVEGDEALEVDTKKKGDQKVEERTGKPGNQKGDQKEDPKMDALFDIVVDVLVEEMVDEMVDEIVDEMVNDSNRLREDSALDISVNSPKDPRSWDEKTLQKSDTDEIELSSPENSSENDVSMDDSVSGTEDSSLERAHAVAEKSQEDITTVGKKVSLEIRDSGDEIAYSQITVGKQNNESLNVEIGSSLEDKKPDNGTDELSFVQVQNSLESEKTVSKPESTDENIKDVADKDKSANNLTELATLLQRISQSELCDISTSTQKQLETQMLEFMLRMRKRS